MTFVATIVGLGLAASAAGLPSKNRHTAKTDTGTLTGVVERDVLVFRGIPYAAPPVGPVALARACARRTLARPARRKPLQAF